MQRELDGVLSLNEDDRIGVLYFSLYWRLLHGANYIVVVFDTVSASLSATLVGVKWDRCAMKFVRCKRPVNVVTVSWVQTDGFEQDSGQ